MLANDAKPNLGDDELQMIWGAAAIGDALNLNPRQAFLQLEDSGSAKVRPEMGRIGRGIAAGSHRGAPAGRW
jgi:hypothetical protein